MGSSEKSIIIQIYNYLDSSFPVVVVVVELKKKHGPLVFFCPLFVKKCRWMVLFLPYSALLNKKIHKKR